ncbi:PilZ domain-containing protein [Marinobacterium sp. YM272]|uniref:PilZ domain-containing protein n=1 Tax=Marinobacterium sp. YM272 TaxID=3421654 RepID=UPI003D7FBCD0
MSVDRRLHPRVFADLSAEANVGSDRFSVQLVDLSVSGFQIEGGGQLASLTPKPGQGGIELGLQFDLSGLEVNSLCRVVYKRRMSVDKAALGLKIVAIDDDARAAIETYVKGNLG